MYYGAKAAKMVPLDRVFLDGGNPRHEKFKDQSAVIQRLCAKEQVLPLAKDIVKHALNPLELFALIPSEGKTYIALEGNRRLCALKLLNDPDLAPANLKNAFRESAEDWEPVDELFAVVFNSRKDMKLWSDRIHAGAAGGRGRRQWNAEQKARHSGYKRNTLALFVLDFAAEQNLISADDREGKLSTVNRYLGNPLMRDALGITVSESSEVSTDLPVSEFKIVLDYFMSDVASNKVHTRHNADHIKRYARKLARINGVTGHRTTSRRVLETLNVKKSTRRAKKIKKPEKPTTIGLVDELEEILSAAKNHKLAALYYSLCTLNLSDHAPILYVGAWSFLESLTALCGRKSDASFPSFINSKLREYGIAVKGETQAVKQAVQNISDIGNITKHHKQAGGFDGEQLANDFETLKNLLLVLAKEAKKKN